LSTFFGHNGKLIFYHGMSDPWFSPLDTVGYYEKMSTDNGGMDKVKDWSRLFLVPGMGHCAGGTATVDSFDMLSAIVDWVENRKITLHLSAPQFEAVSAKAVAAGATAVMPVADQFWVDRYGLVKDPFGFNWGIATHLEDPTPDEIKERMAKMASGGAS